MNIELSYAVSTDRLGAVAVGATNIYIYEPRISNGSLYIPTPSDECAMCMVLAFCVNALSFIFLT